VGHGDSDFGSSVVGSPGGNRFSSNDSDGTYQKACLVESCQYDPGTESLLSGSFPVAAKPRVDLLDWCYMLGFLCCFGLPSIAR